MTKERICGLFGATLLATGCQQQPDMAIDLKQYCPKSPPMEMHLEQGAVVQIGENHQIRADGANLYHGVQITYSGEGANAINGVYEKSTGVKTEEHVVPSGVTEQWTEIAIDHHVIWVANMKMKTLGNNSISLSIDCRQPRF